jgi:sulfide dehydrogenase cytochrome subunit
MRTTDLFKVMCLALFISGSVLAAGPSAKLLAYSCAGCHGTNGSSVGLSNPHIAGMNKKYFIESMRDYQLDRRDSTIMNRLAKAFTADQIERMAEFYAAQPLRLQPQVFDPAKAKLGAEYHQKYCEKCHEDGGRAAGDGGTLAGQWELYLRYTMDDFLSGDRELPRKTRVKVERMLKEHGLDAVDALIHHYISYK